MQGEAEIWTEDVLNLGVRPDVMIPLVAERFRAAGGVVLDKTAATSFTVHDDGVAVGLGDDGERLTARLLLDCMGHASPIVRQLRCARSSPRSFAWNTCVLKYDSGETGTR